MNNFVRILVTIGIALLLVMAKAFFDGMMGWRHGGGAIPMTIFSLIIIYVVRKVWKANILKKENTKIIQNLPSINTKDEDDEILKVEKKNMNNITKICITCVICSFIISIGILLSTRHIVVSKTNDGYSILYIIDNITGELKIYNMYGERIVRREPQKKTTGTPNWRDYQ